MILAEFFATRIRFIEADPDPADQIETDPYGSGSATLVESFVLGNTDQFQLLAIRLGVL